MESSPRNFKCTIPGSVRGTAPKRFGKGRRCRCGAILNEYTKGEWCNVCLDNPDRKHHYTVAPKEHVMEPVKIKASEAAKRLGLSGRELKDLEHAGRIVAAERGRGMFGNKYFEDDVVRLKAELDQEQAAIEDVPRLGVKPSTAPAIEDEGLDFDDEPSPAEQVEEEAKVCCGQRPEGAADCADCPKHEPEDESQLDLDSLSREFAKHYARHLAAAEEAEHASTRFREAVMDASLYAQDAERVRDQLESLGVNVTGHAGMYAGPPYLGLPVDREPDLEIRAMQQILDALEPLDREQQVRAVRWATQRYGIDRPLPAPQELVLDSRAASGTAPVHN